jgi:hypothetical protein
MTPYDRSGERGAGSAFGKPFPSCMRRGGPSRHSQLDPGLTRVPQVGFGTAVMPYVEEFGDSLHLLVVTRHALCLKILRLSTTAQLITGFGKPFLAGFGTISLGFP